MMALMYNGEQMAPNKYASDCTFTQTEARDDWCGLAICSIVRGHPMFDTDMRDGEFTLQNDGVVIWRGFLKYDSTTSEGLRDIYAIGRLQLARGVTGRVGKTVTTYDNTQVYKPKLTSPAIINGLAYTLTTPTSGAFFLENYENQLIEEKTTLEPSDPLSGLENWTEAVSPHAETVDVNGGTYQWQYRVVQEDGVSVTRWTPPNIKMGPLVTLYTPTGEDIVFTATTSVTASDVPYEDFYYNAEEAKRTYRAGVAYGTYSASKITDQRTLHTTQMSRQDFVDAYGTGGTTMSYADLVGQINDATGLQLATTLTGSVYPGDLYTTLQGLLASGLKLCGDQLTAAYIDNGDHTSDWLAWERIYDCGDDVIRFTDGKIRPLGYMWDVAIPGLTAKLPTTAVEADLTQQTCETRFGAREEQ